jgi:hypothetical protein
LLLQVRCYKQKRDERKASTHEPRASERARVCAAATTASTAAAGANKSERAQTEGMRSQTSANKRHTMSNERERAQKHKPRASGVERTTNRSAGVRVKVVGGDNGGQLGSIDKAETRNKGTTNEGRALPAPQPQRTPPQQGPFYPIHSPPARR